MFFSWWDESTILFIEGFSFSRGDTVIVISIQCTKESCKIRPVFFILWTKVIIWVFRAVFVNLSFGFFFSNILIAIGIEVHQDIFNFFPWWASTASASAATSAVAEFTSTLCNESSLCFIDCDVTIIVSINRVEQSFELIPFFVGRWAIFPSICACCFYLLLGFTFFDYHISVFIKEFKDLLSFIFGWAAVVLMKLHLWESDASAVVLLELHSKSSNGKSGKWCELDHLCLVFLNYL